MARGDVTATVHIDGLGAFRRDLKRFSPVAAVELRRDVQGVAQRVANEAAGRAAASSFTYRGVATAGLRASVRSAGPKPHVARFVEFGAHPRGGPTFVPGRNIVGGILEEQHDRIVDELGGTIMRAAGKTGWR